MCHDLVNLKLGKPNLPGQNTRDQPLQDILYATKIMKLYSTSTTPKKQKKLVDYGDYRIDKKELQCLLNPQDYLNGETIDASIHLLRDKCVKEREDGSVYLETTYNTKKDVIRIDERNFIVEQALTYLKHDMISIESILIEFHVFMATPYLLSIR